MTGFHDIEGFSTPAGRAALPPRPPLRSVTPPPSPHWGTAGRGTRPAADAVRGNVLYGPRSLSGLPARRLNGMAIASVIVGIVSFVLPVFGLTSATAVLLGWTATSQIRRFSSETGRGLALAGITLATASFLIHALLFGMYAAALSGL